MLKIILKFLKESIPVISDIMTMVDAISLIVKAIKKIRQCVMQYFRKK